MLPKVIFTFFCALLLHTHSAFASWDYALTTQSKILFYDDNWSEITSSAHQFDQLSAIAFDETEETIYFNDRMHNNGSIFSLKLPRTNEDPHIFEKVLQRTQTEEISSIAYDPLNRNIYWSDRLNRKIYFMSIDANYTTQPTVFLDFTDDEAIPDGVAVDVCRRKLYWTNSNFKNASIERIELDGSERELIVNSNLYLPHGIVIDQWSDRIFWVVDQQGIHFSVESAYLNGSDRHVIVQGLNNVPFSLAVTRDSIYWTDLTHNAVWSTLKFPIRDPSNQTDAGVHPGPYKVKSFPDQPRGIVARGHFLTGMQSDPHCGAVVRKIRSRLLQPKPTRDPIDAQIQSLRREYCLNGGEYSESGGVCICRLGYKGSRCESSECHNYCVHGTCAMSAMGFPKCTCQKGFYGERCQSYKCSHFCFNDGVCKIETNGEATCECVDNFGGQRCEQNSTEICSLFCRMLKHEPDMYVPFGCHDICEELSLRSEENANLYGIPTYKHLEVCKNTSAMSDTIVIVLVVGVLACLSLVLMIVLALRRFYKPLRPRIKKTFVVRKHANMSSDTPLTNRPMATEQCEITIENCCNMNICDTPCFDPKLVQQSLTRDNNSKEDKKVLIHNMEDELY